MADDLNAAARADLAERLSVWAQPLCWTPSLTSAAMYRRIRVLLPAAVLDAYGVSVELDDWPEPGLRFRLERGGPTREELESRLGEGVELRTLHPGGPRTIVFRIGEPGAPFEVSVCAIGGYATPYEPSGPDAAQGARPDRRSCRLPGLRNPKRGRRYLLREVQPLS